MAGLDFLFYGGRPSLDFVNTLRRRKDPSTPTRDLLADKGIRVWFERARAQAAWATELPGLVPDMGPSDLLIDNGTDLRQAILSLVENEFDTAADGANPHQAAQAVLNDYAKGAPLTYQVGGDGLLLPSANPETILSFVASDAIRLFSSAASQCVKVCAHERCGIVFEDRSNGMRRQWCSMKDCGNRAKVARYASTTGSA